MSSQADALLAAAAEGNGVMGDAALGELVLGAGIDIPYDENEPHIVIGKDRFITVPDILKRLAVQHDHNVETVTFDCPRYWDNHDMSVMKVYINYIRSDKEVGSYAVSSPIVVDENDTTIMHFRWTISREVTKAMGNIVFLVCIKDVDDAGNESEHWNSELCKDCYISEGLEALPRIVDEYPDIITYMLSRLDLWDINVKQYVKEYLDNSDTLADTIKRYVDELYAGTDKTLSVEGGIADAKAVGDKFTEVTDSITLVNEALPFTIVIDDESKTINFIDR